MPVDFGILLDDGWLDAHYIRVMGSYVTDSRQDLETLDASLLYSFDIPSLGIGATKKPWGERYPQFTWRPWIGLDHGSVSKTAGVPDLEAEKSYLRLRADVDATLWLADFFALNGRYAHVTFLDGLERSYNYAEISAIMYLDDSQMFSIGATYRRGSPTPQFNDVDNFTLWTGFKF